MIRIVADDKIPFLRGALEQHAQVDYLPGRAIARHHLENFDALIVRTRTRCDEKLLKGTAVKYIATATIGHDHIDKEYCLSNGIQWTNAPGCNAGSVAQYIASALAYIIHRKKTRFEDLTLGIIGAGRIGSRIEEMAHVLGIPTLVNDPPRERAEEPGPFVSLEHILQHADIITMHVPLNLQGEDKTFHLAGKHFFESMKPGTWFINSSRGEVHQTQELTMALQSGHLGGAILDVWENEPLIDPELLKAAQIATPHIAGYSLDGKANGTAMCVRAISQYFQLGLEGWHPEDLPVPRDPLIRLNCKDLTPEEVFYHLAFSTYNIQEDAQRLRLDPAGFESHREQYPVRREARAYQVSLEHCSEEIRKMTKGLGFKC